MAITQDRMISLLNAAIDFRQAFLTLAKAIESAQNATDPKEALWLLSRRVGPGMLEHPVDAEVVIVKEWNHFRKNLRRNQRVAEHQRQMRREKGVPIRKEPELGMLSISGRISKYEFDDGSEAQFNRVPKVLPFEQKRDVEFNFTRDTAAMDRIERMAGEEAKRLDAVKRNEEWLKEQKEKLPTMLERGGEYFVLEPDDGTEPEGEDNDDSN